MDLHGKVTVFVISVDDINFPYCLDALEKQNCQFDLQIIRNVAPMEKAFQEMLDECKTPFYVQVDEDMILHPHAIKTLYKDIISTPEEVFMVAYPLFDKHLKRPITGVKIYRHNIASQFPYEESFSCEMSQLERAQQAGYTYKSISSDVNNKDACLGEHGVHWTPMSVFERYRNLFQRFRKYDWMDWLAPWPQVFADRYAKYPTEINLYAFLGTVAGLTSSLEGCNKEKDFRTYATGEDFQMARTMFAGKGPDDMNVYQTTKCNFQCRGCRRGSKDLETSPDVTASLLDKALRMFPNVRTMCIAGFGEPLTSRKVFSIVKTANRYGINPSLITNGSLVLDRFDEIKQAGLSSINVSLNYPTEESHRSATRTNTWGNIIEGIRRLVGECNFPVSLSKVCFKDSYQDIPQFLALAESLQVNQVLFVNSLPYDESAIPNIITTADKQVLQDLQSFRELQGAELVSKWPIPLKKYPTHRCNSPWKVIGIDGRGFLTGCRRVFPPSEHFTHIDNENIWHSNHFVNLRKSVLGDGKYSSACDQCFGNSK